MHTRTSGGCTTVNWQTLSDERMGDMKALVGARKDIDAYFKKKGSPAFGAFKRRHLKHDHQTTNPGKRP